MLNDRLKLLLDGQIRFCVKNGFVAEFADACDKQKLRLHDLHEEKGSLYGSVGRDDFEEVCRIAADKGMQIDIRKRSGAFFLAKRNRLRWGIPVGIVLSLLLTGLLSSMIWQVNVSGCEKLSAAYVQDFFAQRGVRKGVFRKGIDVVALRDAALYEMEQLLWVSLYFDGCVAHIEVRERELQAESDYARPVNVVASYGGEIVRADIFEGEPYARIGKAVAKGDLLAGGALMMPGGGVRFVHAKADVIARTHRQLKCSVLLERTVQCIEKSADRKRVNLFGLYTPIFPTFGTDCSERSECNPAAGNVVLPIGIIYEGYRRMQSVQETLPQTVAILQVLAEYALQETELLKGKKTLDRTLELTVQHDRVQMNGAYICEENICKEQPLQVEQIP